jgi:hypothetical protein
MEFPSFHFHSKSERTLVTQYSPKKIPSQFTISHTCHKMAQKGARKFNVKKTLKIAHETREGDPLAALFYLFLIFLSIRQKSSKNFYVFVISSILTRHVLPYLLQNSSRTREICVNDFECESDNENRGSTRPPSQPQQQVTMKVTSKKDNPILPDQDLVKTFEKLDQDEETSRNGHYELVHIGKMASEPSLKYNATTAKAPATKECTHWCRNNSDKSEFKHQQQPQTASLTNINGGGGNNNNNGASDTAASSNFYILRTRTQTKSLSTRISSLKRESKTTRTLSIVMFTFIACWLPFFIQYLLVSVMCLLKE